MGSPDREHEGWVVTEHRPKIKEPPLYKVLLHNDDYTTMEFVVMILEIIFHKGSSEATQIMLNVHQQDVGVAGIYTHEVADTKISLVHDLARKHEYPLKCSMEKA